MKYSTISGCLLFTAGLYALLNVVSGVPDTADVKEPDKKSAHEQRAQDQQALAPSLAPFTRGPAVNAKSPTPRILSTVEDIQQLSKGDTFSITRDHRGVFESEELIVSDVETYGKVSQIKAQSRLGSKAIVTTANTMVNISLNTKQGFYDYSGRDFSGIVTVVTNLNVADDIALPLPYIQIIDHSN